jgi:hypothetical protein
VGKREKERGKGFYALVISDMFVSVRVHAVVALVDVNWSFIAIPLLIHISIVPGLPDTVIL